MAQEIADSTLIDTWGSGGNIVEPDISKIIEGWQLGEQPPHEYMNWLQNTFGSKLNHILKNGVASWNNETEYLAGSSVQHNSNIWLCKTTNTNSEPADVNANWKRIITVESLTTVLGGYVKNSGDETIAGVKTFSSSPIVPTPTTDTQAANKDYVDSVAVSPDASTTVKGIVELATNAETATGTDTTRAVTPANLLSLFIDSNQSLSENGYQKLPGGLIIQWGWITDAISAGTINFPVSFPSYRIIFIQLDGTALPSNSDIITNNQSSPSLSSFNYIKVGQPIRFQWFAIGY